MPATLTGRGAQVVLDPMSDTVKAIRGAYAATYEANAAKHAADSAAGLAPHGNSPDGTTATSGATDVSVIPSVGAKQAASLLLGSQGGPIIISGAGAGRGNQPSGSIWIRTDGAPGARLYVSQGAGSWLPIATV
jgi:hypothetical protein